MADDDIIRVPFLPVGAPVGHAITRLVQFMHGRVFYDSDALVGIRIECEDSDALVGIRIECECGWDARRDSVAKARAAHAKHCDLERAVVRARAYRAAAFDYMREHLPAFPCGFDEPRVMQPDEPHEGLPPEWRDLDLDTRRRRFGGGAVVCLEGVMLTPDEARGFARRLLELADEAER